MKRAYRNTSRKAFRMGYLGSKLNQILTFITTEQLAVGHINEPAATSFTIAEGEDVFSIDGSGNLSFQSVPEYDTQRTYNCKVATPRTNYNILVFVTILTTATLLTGTEIMYNDTYVKAA